jgi:hypothetical protein
LVLDVDTEVETDVATDEVAELVVWLSPPGEPV